MASGNVLGTGVVLAAILTAGAGDVRAQAALKIGVFDSQRVSEETIEGKRVQAQLKQAKEQKQREIDDETKKIQELQQQLDAKGLSLSEEKRTSLEIDIRRRMLELESRKDIASRGFQLEVAAAEARFNEKLRGAIADFAKQEQFTVILEGSNVAWASASIDVTTALIDTFNRLFPAPPAASP
jgi:Skp family chaperone for outer membrane proteins